MKKWIPSVCLAVLLSNFHVSADVISGTVVDSATGNALDSVRVSCGLTHVTYTAPNGSFTLNTASGVLNHTPIARENVKISYEVSNLQGGIVRQISLNKPDFSRLPPGIYIVTEKAAGWSPVSYKVCNVLNVLNVRPVPLSTADDRNGIAKVQADAVSADTLTFSTAEYLTIQRIVAGSQSGLIVKMTKAPGTMAFILGGTFQMGSNNTVLESYSGGDEEPVHSVTVSAFYMDSTPVTQASYQALMGVNPSYFDTGASAPRRPAETMTWYDAVLYCNARSKHDGYDTVYSYTSITGTPGNGCTNLSDLTMDFTQHGYRLPTEAEWEYACRAGSTADYYWRQSYPPLTTADTAEISAHAWWYYNTPNGTQPVATKPANEFGLYDMAGNVNQWCNDWWGSYSATSQTNPTGAPSGNYRVLRGGSWNDSSGVNNLCAASRAYSLLGGLPYHGIPVNGFRCVRR